VEHFPLHTLGKTLIIVGGIIVVLGVIFLAGGKLPCFGNLPGDIHIKGKQSSFYFPVVTMLLVSVILTIIVNLIFRK
jgi:Protein of unknown function (DUF2905)